MRVGGPEIVRRCCGSGFPIFINSERENATNRIVSVDRRWTVGGRPSVGCFRFAPKFSSHDTFWVNSQLNCAVRMVEKVHWTAPASASDRQYLSFRRQPVPLQPSLQYGFILPKAAFRPLSQCDTLKVLSYFINKIFHEFVGCLLSVQLVNGIFCV